jgi:hypothetical protein
MKNKMKQIFLLLFTLGVVTSARAQTKPMVILQNASQVINQPEWARALALHPNQMGDEFKRWAGDSRFIFFTRELGAEIYNHLQRPGVKHVITDVHFDFAPNSVEQTSLFINDSIVCIQNTHCSFAGPLIDSYSCAIPLDESSVASRFDTDYSLPAAGNGRQIMNQAYALLQQCEQEKQPQTQQSPDQE